MLDFLELITVSKSRVQFPELETKKKEALTQIAKVEENMFAEEEDRKIEGASDCLLLDVKKYTLYIAPLLPCECNALCQTYIGAGASIFLKKNCHKVHRRQGQQEEVNISRETICVQKSNVNISSGYKVKRTMDRIAKIINRLG